MIFLQDLGGLGSVDGVPANYLCDPSDVRCADVSKGETTKERIVERGYEVIELEMSEFREVDGGLSCLSLRLAGGKP